MELQGVHEVGQMIIWIRRPFRMLQMRLSHIQGGISTKKGDPTLTFASTANFNLNLSSRANFSSTSYSCGFSFRAPCNGWFYILFPRTQRLELERAGSSSGWQAWAPRHLNTEEHWDLTESSTLGWYEASFGLFFTFSRLFDVIECVLEDPSSDCTVGICLTGGLGGLTCFWTDEEVW